MDTMTLEQMPPSIQMSLLNYNMILIDRGTEDGHLKTTRPTCNIGKTWKDNLIGS